MKDLKATFENGKTSLRSRGTRVGRSMTHLSIHKDVEVCKKILREAILFCDSSIKELVWLPEYDEIAEWLSDNQGKGLFLTGNVGTGKSNIVRHVIPMLFASMEWPNAKIYKCYHARDIRSNLSDIKEYKLICLDDIGTEEMVNDYGNKYEPFMAAIDSAEDGLKPMLVSTNMTLKQIAVRYDDRTLDRILRLFKIVKIKSKSLREKPTELMK